MSLNKSKALRTAEKYVLQGKIPAAIEEYRKVADADPADLTTINTLGDLHVRAGNIPEAISNFSRIAESYREGGFTLKAIAMYKKISKLDPTNVETAMKLANLYSQQGLLVEARQQYLHVADAYARKGQTRKALEAYQKIADLDPSNTSVRMKLGEIYSREGLMDQAHDAFILAGSEFLRKGDAEQALNANLKAVALDPESRHALTNIATIYTEMGQADRAVNILCDAFERNPGDVELLTILGRTYLSAGRMDEAERTFLSLVELDRNRYHYLLEVGRRFLQLGDLDRAAEQIDGCLEILIAKREEDKAIEFLRRILDREMNHLGSLKRLSQIFLRIREDHNLIATLNSLAEAAMRKGDDAEAVSALKELVALEPDEPMHRQRLYNLGVENMTVGDSPDVVRATGPLDYQSAVFDDAFIIRQISEAEILAGHGQVDHAVMILEEIINYAPDNVQVHQKLKDIYLRADFADKAARTCFQLSRIFEARGEPARAAEYLSEARLLDASASPEPASASSQETSEGDRSLTEPSEAFNFISEPEDRKEQQSNGDYGFEFRDGTNRFDLSLYQTGALVGDGGFVTLPPEIAGNAEPASTDSGAEASSGQDFRYSDTLVGRGNSGSTAAGDKAFEGVNEVLSDTMPRALREEIEGIDFYIAQGYTEIARESLDRLRAEHGDHPEISGRYHQLGVAVPPPLHDFVADPVATAPSTLDAPDSASLPDDGASRAEASFADLNLEASDDSGHLTVEPEPQTVQAPFLVQKESGQLDSDLIFSFTTSDLIRDSVSGHLAPSSASLELPVAADPSPLPDHSGALVGSATEDDSDASPSEETHFADPVVEDSLVEAEPGEAPPPPSHPGQAELEQMFAELKENTGDLKRLIDYETHFSLGLAYKDMDLLDEAIEQFQMAFRLAAVEGREETFVQCCHMLGVCFKRKSLPKVAVMWFERGLKIPNRPEDEYQALRYEIGLCYEEMGDFDKAIDHMAEVYGIDVNYRHVGDKIKRLQEMKNTC